MKVFIAALILVALCLAGLCFNIIFRKNGQFPQTEIEGNEQMKKLGIRCVRQEEIQRWKERHDGNASDVSKAPSCSGKDGCSSCAGCAFYKE